MRLPVALFSLALVVLATYAAVVRGAFAAPERSTGLSDTLRTAVVPALADLGPGGVSGPRTIYDTVSPYTVSGATEAEILRDLITRGPSNGDERFFGMTQADLQLGYRTAETDDACWLVDVEVRLGIDTTLPEWDRPRGAAGSLRRDWHRFASALARHESRHKEIVQRGAAKVYRAVVDLQAPTCAEVEAEARRRLSRIETEMEAAHRRYDDQTGHGRTEGAVWPVR